MGLEGQEFNGSPETEEGPSWQKKHWPIDDADELNSALDPTQMGIEIKALLRNPASRCPMPKWRWRRRNRSAR